jgi:hypothetical protein
MAKKAKSENMPRRVPAPRTGRPADSKAIVVILKPESWKAMRQLAVDLDTTLQGLGIEAFNDLMAKHGHKVKIESAWEPRFEPK